MDDTKVEVKFSYDDEKFNERANIVKKYLVSVSP